MGYQELITVEKLYKIDHNFSSPYLFEKYNILN